MKTISDVNVELLQPEPVSDARLHAMRRLDWRFLLPAPSLIEVAYLGPQQGLLVKALRLFGGALTVIEPSSEPATPSLCYDVVVARIPSLNVLKRANALVRSGGFIYIEAGWMETFRQLRSRRAFKADATIGLFLFPANYISALEKLGFGDIRAYWHWPNFESCTKIIQLTDHEAPLYLFTQGREGLRARLKMQSGRLLLRTGAVKWFAPCFSVVARKQKSE